MFSFWCCEKRLKGGAKHTLFEECSIYETRHKKTRTLPEIYVNIL